MALMNSHSPEISDLFYWMICRLIKCAIGFLFLFCFFFISFISNSGCLPVNIAENLHHYQKGTLTTKALTESEYVTTQTKAMPGIQKKRLAELQWATPIYKSFQAPAEDIQVTQRKDRKRSSGSKELCFGTRKKCCGKAFCGQLHRYVCAQTTRLLLFKFSLGVLKTKIIEEVPVL